MTTFLAGSSGLSAYLIPYHLKNPKEKNKLNNFFLTFESIYKSKNTEKLRIKEKENLKKLQNLFSEISKAVKDSDDLKNLFNQEMNKFLDSISLSENKLSSLYKEHKEKLEQLSKLFEKLFENYLEKDKKQASLFHANYSEEILSKLKTAISSWESNFGEFVEAINEQEKINSSSGGGQSGEASEKAKKTLEEVKQALTDFKFGIQTLSFKVDNSKLQIFLKEKSLQDSLSKIKWNISNLNYLVSWLRVEAEIIGDKSKETIDKLNDFRTKLIDTNTKLEDLKWKILEFKNQEGKIKSSLCKNIEHKEKEECKTFLIST